MKDEKYLALLAKRSEMLKWSKAAEDAIYNKMESVRLSGNYSQSDFNELLCLPCESTYKNVVARRRGFLRLEFFLRFCYLFGYDVRSATTLPPKQTALDTAIYELAAILASCSYEGLRDLANKTYNVDSIPPETRRKLALALRELGRIMEPDANEEPAASEPTAPESH